MGDEAAKSGIAQPKMQSRLMKALALMLALAFMAPAMSHEEWTDVDTVVPETSAPEIAFVEDDLTADQKQQLAKAVHDGATLQQKFFDKADANKALKEHLKDQQAHAALLKTSAVPMTLPQLKSPDVAKCLDLPEVPSGLGSFAKKVKDTQEKLHFHYAELCADEIKEKHAEKVNAAKIAALKESLEKAQEVSTKQGSVKQEKAVKVQSKNQETTTKYVAENALKEKSNKRACDTEVKTLKESLGKKKKIDDETKSKIYEKWGKRLKSEKEAKKAEKEAKIAKKKFEKTGKAQESS